MASTRACHARDRSSILRERVILFFKVWRKNNIFRLPWHQLHGYKKNWYDKQTTHQMFKLASLLVLLGFFVSEAATSSDGGLSTSKLIISRPFRRQSVEFEEAFGIMVEGESAWFGTQAEVMFLSS